VVAVLSAAKGAQSVSAAAVVAPLISAPAPNKALFDPLNPVRSPAKNFGSATLPNGIKSTPLPVVWLRRIRSTYRKPKAPDHTVDRCQGYRGYPEFR